jgi:hypothetical protein
MASCPFCLADHPERAFVCASCARDIAIPANLIAERDELLKKREILRDELQTGRRELEKILNHKKLR